MGQTQESPITVQFGLGPENVDPETLKLWNYDFTLILTVSLTKDKLVTSIDVENTGKEAFEFNWLFHTYYRIHDITDTLVTNLIDQQCYDQLIGESYIEKAPVISFHEEFDRIYSKVSLEKSIQVVDKGQVLFNLHRKTCLIPLYGIHGLRKLKVWLISNQNQGFIKWSVLSQVMLTQWSLYQLVGNGQVVKKSLLVVRLKFKLIFIRIL